MAEGAPAKSREKVGVGVGVLVFDTRQVCSSTRVLLGRRKGAHGAGTWALPGGWLEVGEEFDACARRELLEETGLGEGHLDAAPGRTVPFVSNNVMEKVHSVTVFVRLDLAAPKAADAVRVCEPHKCYEWRWCSLAEPFPEPAFPPLASLVRSEYWAALTELFAPAQ